jgi:hypothetical protein
MKLPLQVIQREQLLYPSIPSQAYIVDRSYTVAAAACRSLLALSPAASPSLTLPHCLPELETRSQFKFLPGQHKPLARRFSLPLPVTLYLRCRSPHHQHLLVILQVKPTYDTETPTRATAEAKHPQSSTPETSKHLNREVQLRSTSAGTSLQKYQTCNEYVHY